MIVTVTLDNCQVGEAFLVTGAWVGWQAGQEYLLTKHTSPGGWKQCISNKMNCFGRSDIGPKPGFWRSSNTSDNFIECLNKNACLGYDNKENKDNLGTCEEGYQGVLCSDCRHGYARSGEDQWLKCANPFVNFIRLLLLTSAILIWNIIMIKSTLSGALERKDVQSIYFKILTNHFQLIALTASFNFRWPFTVVQFFDTVKPTTMFMTHLLSVDCLLDQRSSDSDDSSIRVYYIKMIVWAVIPLILILITYVFWSIYFCFQRPEIRHKRRSRVLATLIIVLFTIHPMIANYMFFNFR